MLRHSEIHQMNDFTKNQCVQTRLNWIYKLLYYLKNLMDMCLSTVSFKDSTMLQSILS